MPTARPAFHPTAITVRIAAAAALAILVAGGTSAWLLVQLERVAALAAGKAVALARANALIDNARDVTALALVGAILLAVLVVRALTASARRPLNEAAADADALRMGDLRAPGTAASGPLHGALDGLRLRMAELVGGARASSAAIGSAAASIGAGSSALSGRTGQQSSSLEQTASSMEELTATVKQNADHAHQASKLAVSASEVAVKGGAVVAEVVGTMASINASSKRIAEIIGVIDGIAFQTNILALNAAVEAARAGEQGRGFAVVASEVRNLAQRSAAAAKEIKVLIDDSVGQVDAGTQLADKAGSTMNEVVASVALVTNIIGEIAAASAEQTTGIEQVNQAIAAMDQATQQNAALVEQAAAAAGALGEHAAGLDRLLKDFKIDASSATPQSAAAVARMAPAALPALAATPPRRPAATPAASSAARTAPSAPRAARATARPARAASAARPVENEDWEEF